jgi:uncharacterized protein
MKTIEITKKRARRIAVHASLLTQSKSRVKKEKGALHIVDSLGYIQIDTISVIERAHHHTLWNRQQDYRHEYLDILLSKKRQVFEYWGHAASILLMKDYRFYLPYMKTCQNPQSGWAKKRKEKCKHTLEDVYSKIIDTGPMGSRDFQPETSVKRNGWWDWKPAKIALEVLFSEGRLMVSGRKGFQRSYDLTSRVLPTTIDRTYPTENETGNFFIRRALKSFGIATIKEICEHIYSADKKNMQRVLSGMIDAGEVIPIRIKSLEKERYFMLKESFSRLLKLKKTVSRLKFLSPFDNLVIQRERIERIFDFSYKIECYVPAPKRKYGYFCLPLLWNDQLIGRMDSKADRKNKTLIIKNLVFEEDFMDIENFLPDLGDAIEKFILINNCTNLVIERINSKTVQQYLKKVFA